MNKYEICVVTKEYRYVEVGAEDDVEAIDKVWLQIENILNRKPQDFDTEVYVEHKEAI